MSENNKLSSRSDEHNRSGEKDLANILIITLVSILSGFILGLLFAPQSGLKTRKYLVEKLKDIIDRGKFTLAEAKVMSGELLEKGKEKVGKVSSKIKRKSQVDVH